MVRNNKNFATISARSLDIRCKTMRLARILRWLAIYYRYFITATRKFAPSRLDNSACALLVCGVSQTVARTNKAVLATSSHGLCNEIKRATACFADALGAQRIARGRRLDAVGDKPWDLLGPRQCVVHQSAGQKLSAGFVVAHSFVQGLPDPLGQPTLDLGLDKIRVQDVLSQSSKPTICSSSLLISSSSARLHSIC